MRSLKRIRDVMGNENKKAISKDLDSENPQIQNSEHKECIHEDVKYKDSWFLDNEFLKSKFDFSLNDFVGPMAFAFFFFLNLEGKEVGQMQFYIYMSIRLKGIVSHSSFLKKKDLNVFMDMKKINIMIDLLWKYPETRRLEPLYRKKDVDLNEHLLYVKICQIYEIIPPSLFDRFLGKDTCEYEENDLIKLMQEIEQLKKRQNCWSE